MYKLPSTKRILKHLNRPPLTLVRTDSSTLCLDDNGNTRLRPTRNAQHVRLANLVMLVSKA